MYAPNPTQKKKLVLLDPDFETADIFWNFLILVAEVEIEGEHPALHNLTRFLLKWDCQSAQRMLLLTLRERLQDRRCYDPVCPLDVFLVAATLDCESTCCAAIAAKPWTWEDVLPLHWPQRGEKGFDVLDPAHWPLETFCMVPPVYHFALQRAFNPQPLARDLYKHYRLKDDAGEAQVRRAKFKWYIAEARSQGRVDHCE
jgi:hypothetical protein